ncbi:hypothetical protein C8R44DRAFT_888977 [Mycena epipterygia]|nr:hypothetical protein C8R44DRAFT_888977 [Mycena epipterygia]
MSFPWAPVAHNGAAVREGLKIVRKVIARDAKTGLTSAEVYRLAIKEPPPPSYAAEIKSSEDVSPPEIKYGKAGRRRIPGPTPPHPRHPIRSLSFLKHVILPMMKGEMSVQKFREKRLVVQTKAKSQPARGSKQQQQQQQQQVTTDTSAVPVETIVYLWRARKPPPRVEKPAPPRPPNVYDYSHMKASKRKAHKARIELAAKREMLSTKSKNLRTEAREKRERELRAVRLAKGRALHEVAEREGLARKALRRAEWEKRNPIPVDPKLAPSKPVARSKKLHA